MMKGIACTLQYIVFKREGSDKMDPIEEIGSSIDYGKPVKKRAFKHKSRSNNYMQQEVDLKKTPFLFFPPGKEMLFLGIYFVTMIV